MSGQSAVLQCRSLRKVFGDIVAVDHVSFVLGHGEILCLLGPSGCGKTTTLRLIAGFEDVDDGRIILKNRCVASKGLCTPPEKRRVGMVFQDYALFPHLSVRENVGYGVKDRMLRQQRVRQLLSLVGLEEMADRMPHELSGGQQQRVALARALAPDPDLLLFDEPFSNLDASLRRYLRKEILDIVRQENKAAIFVTHDQEEALFMGDRVAVMYKGRILQLDTPRKVYQHPATPTVAGLIGEANWVEGEVRNGVAHTLIGKVPVTQPANGQVQLMVRPEDIQLQLDKNGVGLITNVHFVGASQVAYVAVTPTLVFKARVPAGSPLKAGDRVNINCVREPVIYTR